MLKLTPARVVEKQFNMKLLLRLFSLKISVNTTSKNTVTTICKREAWGNINISPVAKRIQSTVAEIHLGIKTSLDFSYGES